jgi:hypothetical protein
VSKMRQAQRAIEGMLSRDERAVKVPKRTSVRGQPHKLAYINDEEAALLRSRGGGVDRDGGQIMHRGVPAYFSENSSSEAGQGHSNSGAADASGPSSGGGYNNDSGSDGGYGGPAAAATSPMDAAAADRRKRLNAGEYIPSETPYATPTPSYAPMPAGLGGPPPGMSSPFAGFGAALGAPPVMTPYALNPAPARPAVDAFAPLPPAPMPMPMPRADQTTSFFDYLRLLRGY